MVLSNVLDEWKKIFSIFSIIWLLDSHPHLPLSPAAMECRANEAAKVDRRRSMSRIVEDLVNSHHQPVTAITQRRRPRFGNERPRVCIVGAGIAGLRCADILIQAGIVPTVFEARDRVGGRVCNLAA